MKKQVKKPEKSKSIKSKRINITKNTTHNLLVNILNNNNGHISYNYVSVIILHDLIIKSFSHNQLLITLNGL